MVQSFARIAGVVFLLVGILGFFFENLLGIFHLDTVHNIFHLVIGVWGLLASSKIDYSTVFAKTAGVVYALIGIVGFFAPELFGMMHVGLSENLLHLIVGAIALYIGFSAAKNQPVKNSKSASR